MRSRRFRSIAALVLALALVAACSESDDDTTAGGDTPSTTTEAKGADDGKAADDAAADLGPDGGHGSDDDLDPDDGVGPDDGHGPDDEHDSGDGPGPDDGHGPDDDSLADPGDFGDISTVTAEWRMTATDVREGDDFATRVVCPEGGSGFTVWGTDTYSDDSSVCTAAVHIGLITFEDGGEVLISYADGLGSYRGSTRNGVTTREWDSWPGSFVFIGARGVPIEGEES